MVDAINRGEYPARYIHQLAISGHDGRAGTRTGEWIVFAKVHGVNYYLTLGTHAEADAVVFQRAKACAIGFPEIMPPPPFRAQRIWLK